MLFAIIIPIYPNILLLTKSVLCNNNENLIITKVKHSYHRPGEKGIVIEKIGPRGKKNIKVKALFTLWIIIFYGYF